MDTSATASGRALSADGVPIAWQRRGSGPPLVIVDPVLMDRTTSVAATLADLLAEHHTVYTYDRRGKGESGDGEEYTPNSEVDDLLAVIQVAGGSAALYGFSSGALLALRTAAQSAVVSRVVALEPPLDSEAGGGERLRQQLQALIDAGQRAEAVRLFQRSIGVPEHTAAGMDVSAFEDAAHTIAYDLVLTETTELEGLAGIKVPVLVLVSAGSDARMQQWARDAAEAISDAELRVLDGDWHGVADEPLATAIEEFLG